LLTAQQLTTTGIFATFLGIAIGLAEFDVKKVQESVPALLDGLKTAFWASVVGVGGALTLKLREHVYGTRAVPSAADVGDEVTAADLAVLLGKIHSALVGSEEGSLISQIKLTRQDTADRLDALKAAQIEALARLSEMSSKTLVEALRDVIRDFNSKISEQFGDNFKELNDAVGRVVVWQDQYRSQVEFGTKRFEDIARLLAQATNDYAAIVERSQAFSQAADDLRTILVALNSENQNLVSVCADLASLLRAAEGSLPSVEAKIIEMSNQLAASITGHQEIVGRAISETANALRNSVDTVSGQLSELGQKTNAQVEALERALARALQDSLTSLGQQLTALSEAFVEDYTPLTQKLRQLVQMAS